MPKQHTIRIRGISVRYLDIGQGDPLIFFHGSGLDARSHLPLLEILSKHYRVIAPDLPGFGRSETPEKDWSLREYGQFFHEFLEKIKITKPILLGFSLGGGVALDLASRTRNISKVIAIDPAAIPLSLPFRTLVFKAVTESMHVSDIKSSAKLSYRIILNLLRNPFRTPGAYRNIRTSLEHGCGKPESISAPALILWGTEDWILPPEHGKLLHKKIPHATLEYVRGHHNWCIFEPERAARRIREFLS